ncbi:MAG: hypothetical protein ABSA11_10205 [Candidatus Bathyarchaeia archaeon]|jgi:hypothetical protein
MRLNIDENNLKRLIIIATFLFIITACTLTAFLPSTHAQLAPATNSTVAAQTGSPTQLSLRYIEFSSDIFFVGEPITMRVGPIRSNQTGEYSATAVITPQIGGVEPFYESYALYSADSNWFTFNFVLGEAGNYLITVWQGGVKQLTREISVYPLSSTSTGGGPANPDTSVEIARTAAEAAGAAQAQSESPGISSQIDVQWVFILLIIVASSIWFLNTIVKS